MRDYNIIGAIGRLVLLIVLGVLCWRAWVDIVIPTFEQNELRSAVYQGEVVDKEIVNPSRGLFSSSDGYYAITIRNTYEYNGETKSVDKRVAVDKETYLAIDIGDWFNSHTLEITDK